MQASAGSASCALHGSRASHMRMPGPMHEEGPVDTGMHGYGLPLHRGSRSGHSMWQHEEM